MEAWLARYIPTWMLEWIKVYVLPFLKLQGRNFVLALSKGVLDTLLFIGLPLVVSVGSQVIWNGRYDLLPEQQVVVEEWAGVASLIAYVEDVPPVVPLVLWYKEGGLQAENPANCEGIMGLYTAVNSGELPCFAPGPLSPEEVAAQLRMGTRVFKSYCPEIHFTTTDPDLIKRCYLYYNAGPRTQMNPDDSAYVMNGYDAAHQDMLHTDVGGRTRRIKALGAWPVHLAIQAQLAQMSEEDGASLPFVRAPLMLAQEEVDHLWAITLNGEPLPAAEQAQARRCRHPLLDVCLVAPPAGEEDALRPALSPLLKPPTHPTSVQCTLLPGVDLVTDQDSLVVAPMDGYLHRYSDEFGHLAIRIENERWTVWLTGLRSYIAGEGDVVAGQPIAAIGGGRNLHYAVFSEVSKGFVDPLACMPEGYCPPEH